VNYCRVRRVLLWPGNSSIDVIVGAFGRRNKETIPLPKLYGTLGRKTSSKNVSTEVENQVRILNLTDLVLERTI